MQLGEDIRTFNVNKKSRKLSCTTFIAVVTTYMSFYFTPLAGQTSQVVSISYIWVEEYNGINIRGWIAFETVSDLVNHVTELV